MSPVDGHNRLEFEHTTAQRRMSRRFDVIFYARMTVFWTTVLIIERQTQGEAASEDVLGLFLQRMVTNALHVTE